MSERELEGLKEALKNLNQNDIKVGGDKKTKILIIDSIDITIYFDKFEINKNKNYIDFFNNNKYIMMIGKNRQLSKVEKIGKPAVKKKSYIREEHDKQKLEHYKEKISKLLEVDKKISITKIAQNLGITRQAIYKNIELNVFIENMKKK